MKYKINGKRTVDNLVEKGYFTNECVCKSCGAQIVSSCTVEETARAQLEHIEQCWEGE